MPGRLDRREGVPLLVAEAPPRGRGPGHRALDGMAGDRLADYAGHPDRFELLERFDTVNLLGHYPGSAGKGTAWPAAKATRAAGRVPLSGCVVLLGRRVSTAFRRRVPTAGMEWGLWLQVPSGCWLTVLPHPSSVNITYNDPGMRELAGRVLGEAEGLARGT